MAIAIILWGTVVLLFVAVIVASRSDVDIRDRELDQRVRSADRQIREIGYRTRAAIIEEALRREAQDPP